MEREKKKNQIIFEILEYIYIYKKKVILEYYAIQKAKILFYIY